MGFVIGSHVVVEAAGLRFFQPAADDTVRMLEVFRASGRRVDVALLGSSRMRRAITVTTFAKELERSLGRPVTAFNFGMQGGIMTTYYILVRDLLDGEQRPELIVLGLGVRSFNSNTPRYARTVRHLLGPGDLFDDLGPRLLDGDEIGAVPLLLVRAPSSILQLWRKLMPDQKAFAQDVLRRGGSFYDPVAPRPAPPDPSSAEARDHRQSLVEKTRARASYVRRTLLASFTVKGRATTAMARLVELTRERDVGLLVVNLPVTEAFAAAAYDTGAYELYLDHLSSGCKRAGVRFVDLNTAVYRPDPFYFGDGEYLRDIGAVYFSRRVARDVVAPELARRSSR
ncbi:MAG: hypothetical protein V3T05_10830 [Myxococcota bacterium]